MIRDSVFTPPAFANEGVPCAPEPASTPISYGNVTTCDIFGIGDSDLFTLEGMAGETVAVLLTFTSGAFPGVQLFGPDDVVIRQASGSSSAFFTAALAQSGPHKLLVRSGGAGSAAYVLTLERVAPPSPRPRSSAKAARRRPGPSSPRATSTFSILPGPPATQSWRN
jgi:hypothetical protein